MRLSSSDFALLQFADWPKVKPTLPFKQVPVYYHDKFSDSPLAQSNTIARYIARQHGLYGSDPATDAQIDQVVDAFEDLLKATTKVLFANKDDWKVHTSRRMYALADHPPVRKRTSNN